MHLPNVHRGLPCNTLAGIVLQSCDLVLGRSHWAWPRLASYRCAKHTVSTTTDCGSVRSVAVEYRVCCSCCYCSLSIESQTSERKQSPVGRIVHRHVRDPLFCHAEQEWPAAGGSQCCDSLTQTPADAWQIMYYKRTNEFCRLTYYTTELHGQIKVYLPALRTQRDHPSCKTSQHRLLTDAGHLPHLSHLDPQDKQHLPCSFTAPSL